MLEDDDLDIMNKSTGMTVFFFQAEDGIRDRNVTGSSDVCSSDLSLNTSCDRSPPTDPHRPLALRMEAARVPDAKNFVAHLTGGNEVPTHDTRAAGQIKLQLSDEDRKSVV